MRHGPGADIDEPDLEISPPKDYAAGVPAVLVSLERAYEQMGVIRTAKTLTRLNQRHASTAPAARGRRRPDTVSPQNSARTAQKPSRRKPPSER